MRFHFHLTRVYLRTKLLHDLSDLVSEFISLGASSSLSIDTARVLSTTGSSKGSGTSVLLNTLVDLILSTHRVAEAPLSIRGLEQVLVANFNANKTVREVIVGHGPIFESPALVGENDFNHEHIGNSIANGLVDEIADGSEGVESILLGRRLRLGLTESTDGLLREDNSTVTISLEVNTNVELTSSVVQMLHTSRSEDDGKLKVLLNIVRAGTVGIGGLNNANAEVISKAGRSNEVTNERGIERRNTIAIEHEEACLRIDPVVNQTIGITIERAASGAGDGLRAGRGSLLRLDEVRSRLRE
jgi:hypothetical protein